MVDMCAEARGVTGKRRTIQVCRNRKKLSAGRINIAEKRRYLLVDGKSQRVVQEGAKLA